MVTLLALIGLILVAGGPVAAHFYLFSPLLGLVVAGAGLALLAFLFFVSIGQFLRNGAAQTSWLAFLFGLLALSGLGAVAYFAYMNPLFDVTTDVQKPPVFLHPAFPFRVERGAEYLDASLRIPRAYDTSWAATQVQLYPNFETALTKAPPAEIYDRAIHLVREQLPFWHIQLDDAKAMHAEWLVEDPYLHIQIDVALDVRGDPKHPYDSRMVLRARSRLEVPDLGLDIALLRDLRVRLNLAAASVEQEFAQKRADFESDPTHKMPDSSAPPAPNAPPPPPAVAGGAAPKAGTPPPLAGSAPKTPVPAPAPPLAGKAPPKPPISGQEKKK